MKEVNKDMLIGEILDAQAKQRETDGTPWQKDRRERESQYSMFADRTETVQMFRGI